MKNLIIVISLFVAGTLANCTKGGEYESLSGPTYVVSAAMDGSNVFPATVNDTTKATVTGWYDEEGNVLTFTLNYRKDTSLIKLDTLVGVQFFKTAPAAGSTPAITLPVVTNISAPAKSNITGSFTRGLAGSTAIPAEEKANLVSGKWYVTLISKKFPSGVSGGQLNLVKN